MINGHVQNPLGKLSIREGLGRQINRDSQRNALLFPPSILRDGFGEYPPAERIVDKIAKPDLTPNGVHPTAKGKKRAW